jgi:radical SAM protein with 4Fe4S-binding SPASM domain
MSAAVPYLEKQRPWEQEQPRSRLADCLPLDTPYSVQIDPSSLCNFRCRFCPTGHPELLEKVGRGRGQLMTWALYERLIEGIAAFPRPLKTLSLHKDGEPLLNPRLADMVALARARGVARKIVLLTNASLLTRERSGALIEAGLDVVRVSVEHVSAEGYRRHTQVFDDYARIVGNVRALREERDRRGARLFIAAKLIDLDLSPQELEVFSRDFAPLCDEIGRTTAQGWSHSDLFDFTLGTRPAVSLDGRTALRPERVACAFPFYTLAVNADGEVSPCMDDWTHKAVVGDANSETLPEIWNGRRLREFRRLHLAGRRGRNEACATCHCVQGIPADSDLDADRERLLGVFGGAP